jgi:hypothetical protein
LICTLRMTLSFGTPSINNVGLLVSFVKKALSSGLPDLLNQIVC